MSELPELNCFSSAHIRSDETLQGPWVRFSDHMDAKAAWLEEAKERFNDPEVAQAFRRQMPPGVRGSTIDTIVALRAAALTALGPKESDR